MSVSGAVVFCDDIRIENNGKHILIGVYGSDLVPENIPSSFPISLWMRLEGLPIGRAPFHLEIDLPGVEENLTIKGDGELQDNSRPALIVLHHLPFKLGSPGDIICRFSVAGGPHVEIGRLAVSPPTSRNDEAKKR